MVATSRLSERGRGKGSALGVGVVWLAGLGGWCVCGVKGGAANGLSHLPIEEIVLNILDHNPKLAYAPAGTDADLIIDQASNKRVLVMLTYVYYMMVWRIKKYMTYTTI